MRIIIAIVFIFSFLINEAQTKIYASSRLARGIIYADANAKNLQYLINTAIEGSTIIFPNGDYYFSKTDSIVNKSLTLQGAERTNLYFKNGLTGLVITRTNMIPYKCAVIDLNIYAQDDRSGTHGNGLEIHSITNVRNVFIKNFGGTGLLMTADVGTSKTDVSHSIVENVEVAECGQGIYTHGGDANAISFYSCSIRDCDTYGANDDSFLGCYFYSCMTHANKLGGYRAMNGNNRSLFIGCYSEGGQPPSQMGGVSTVIGGIKGFGAGWKKIDSRVTIIPDELIEQ